MAMLKDSLIAGDLRVTGTIYGNVPLDDLVDADDLKAIEALSGTSGLLKKTSANTWTLDTTAYKTGTVTSVRVQATSPVVSSVSAAQTSSLNTTISLADNYGDTKNPYASKNARYVLAAPASAAGEPTFRQLTNADVGLGNVENTKLSTWTGSTNITTVGTITTGTVPWARLSNVPNSFTPASHAHGQITNDGKIADNTTITSSDSIVYSDASNSGILKKDSAVNTANALMNALATGSSVLTADDYIITQYAGGGTTNTTYHRRPAKVVRVGGLTTARNLGVKLDSTTAVTFDGTANQTNIPISGTLSIANGGTGVTTIEDARKTWKIIAEKDYTGVIASANSDAGGIFHFLKIRPTTFNTQWTVKGKVWATTSANAAYTQNTEFMINGDTSVYRAYANFNSRNTTGALYYYIVPYCLKEAGYNAGYPHCLGINLRYATNNTNTSWKRDFHIEIWEADGCTVEFFDTMTAHGSVPGYGTTNYNNYWNLNAIDAGLQETSDANDANYYNREQYGSKKAKNAIQRYMLMLSVDDEYLMGVTEVDNTVATTKAMSEEKFDPFREIFYWASTTRYAAEANIGDGMYRQYLCDIRYALNVGGYDKDSLLTARKPLYLVASPTDDNMAVLHTTPFAQSLPTTEDGLLYIYLGMVYPDTKPYRVYLTLKHPVYKYINGKVREIKPAAEIANEVNWDNAGIIPVSAGGTGSSDTLNQGGVIYASTTTSYGSSATGTTGQYLKSNAAAAPTWASFVKPVVTWANGTTAGPTLKVQATGGTSDTKAIPVASRSYSGVVTTDEQTFAGTKGFDIIKRNGRNGSATTTWTGDTLLYNGNAVQVGEYWYSFNNNNDATKINTGQFFWRQYSPQSASGTTSTTGKYETYTLPAVDAGLSDNRNYSILTTKSHVSIAQGGTGTGTAPTKGGVIYASSTTAYASTGAGTSGYLLQSGGSNAPSWINATNSNTASTIVKRDASGNFSAGTITASLTGHASLDLPLSGGTMTGTLILSGDPNNDNDAATKHYVDGIVAARDAMVFKGTLAGAASTTYTPAANRGDTYKVSNAGLINGEPVEVGDILICITDSTVAATSSNVSTVKANWVIVQNNIDGAVFKSTNAFVDGRVLIAEGANGKIKTSDYTIAKSVPSNAVFTDTHQNIILQTTKKGYITAVETTPTGTAAAQEGIADTGVYLTTTAGQINATSYKINEKSYISYDTTVDAIGFTFV